MQYLWLSQKLTYLAEEVMLGAVVYGHEQSQAIINAIKEFAAEVASLLGTGLLQRKTLRLKIKLLALAG